jgi:hypothetical protein
MTVAIILIVAAALALIIILRVAVWPGLQIFSDASHAVQLEPIDMEAFRNLIDPAEDQYLRCRLPAPEFRRVRRERLRAAAAYVQVAGRNAVVLIRMSQGALYSGDIRTAAVARELIGDAILLRRNAAFALCRIYVALAWPDATFTSAPLLDRYQQMNVSAMLLGRLQNPAAPVRISAS